MEKYVVGDIVQLKSGGPRMTVEENSSTTTYVVCQWFAGNKLERGTFQPESLKKVQDEPKTK